MVDFILTPGVAEFHFLLHFRVFHKNTRIYYLQKSYFPKVPFLQELNY